VRANLGRLSLEYSFLYREFINDSDPEYHLYDPANHPFDATDSKYGAVNYDYRDGELEIDRAPESEKFVHTVKAKYDVDARQNIFASYIHSTTTNTSVDELGQVADGGSTSELDINYDAGMLNWTTWLGKSIKCSLSGRYQNIDADDATYTLKGVTSRPQMTSPTRGSQMKAARTQPQGGLHVSGPGRPGLRGGYEYESISRDNTRTFLGGRGYKPGHLKRPRPGGRPAPRVGP